MRKENICFSPGEWVIRTDNSGYITNPLVIGDKYRVKTCYKTDWGYGITLEWEDGGYDAWRFVSAKKQIIKEILDATK